MSGKFYNLQLVKILCNSQSPLINWFDCVYTVYHFLIVDGFLLKNNRSLLKTVHVKSFHNKSKHGFLNRHLVMHWQFMNY